MPAPSLAHNDHVISLKLKASQGLVFTTPETPHSNELRVLSVVNTFPLSIKATFRTEGARILSNHVTKKKALSRELF